MLSHRLSPSKRILSSASAFQVFCCFPHYTHPAESLPRAHWLFTSLLWSRTSSVYNGACIQERIGLWYDRRLSCSSPQSEAPSLTMVFPYNPCTGKCARGFSTLVNTHDGPQNTLSSISTPSYTDTLFWIRTPLPILTLLPTYILP